MVPVHHVHVMERGHVATLCCASSQAFFVLYVRFFSFVDRSVLFSPIKMDVRQIISS